MTVSRQRTVPLPTPPCEDAPLCNSPRAGRSRVIPGSLVTTLQERGERLCRCVGADADGRAHARRHAEFSGNGTVLSGGAVRNPLKLHT
jgi:hypothetical protein